LDGTFAIDVVGGSAVTIGKKGIAFRDGRVREPNTLDPDAEYYWAADRRKRLRSFAGSGFPTSRHAAHTTWSASAATATRAFGLSPK
jgi:hypothetical protein